MRLSCSLFLFCVCLSSKGVETVITFEGGTNGLRLSNSGLSNSTYGASGSWTLTGSPTGLTFSVTGQKAFLNPVPVINTNAQDGSGTLGLSANLLAHPQQSATFTTALTNRTCSAGVWFKSNLPDTNYQTEDIFTLYCYSLPGQSGANDFANWKLGGLGSFQVLTSEDLGGADQVLIQISSNTWYWLTMQYTPTAIHYAVYDTNLVQVGHIDSTSTGLIPEQINIGLLNNANALGDFNMYWDNIVTDFTSGVFPLLPTSPAAQSRSGPGRAIGRHIR